MSDLCPSCREPLDWPSGDGCAAMTKHKENKMTDYKQTRDAAGLVTSRFANMLKNLQDDYEDEIVVVSLMKYYDMCAKPNKIDNTAGEYIDPDEDLLWAIERILADYMNTHDFNAWLIHRYGGRK